MVRVIWSPQALADLEAIGDYIARESPAYAQVFVDGFYDATERLELFPRMGRKVPDLNDSDLREIFYKGYRLFHVIGGDEGDERVEILAVYHMARQFGGESGLE